MDEAARCQGSTICFFAVLNGVDAERFTGFSEANAVVADTQAEFRRIAVVKLFCISSASLGQAMNGRKDIHGDVPQDGADVGFGFVGETNRPQAGSRLRI